MAYVTGYWEGTEDVSLFIMSPKPGERDIAAEDLELWTDVSKDYDREESHQLWLDHRREMKKQKRKVLSKARKNRNKKRKND